MDEFRRLAPLLLLLVTAAAHAQAPANGAGGSSDVPQPFTAHYTAQWKGISIASSDLVLKHDSAPDHYVYRWVISARGIFRLAYSDDLVQQSWFSIADHQVRPQRYLGEEGGKSVAFTFDWESGHAQGTSEGRPIDIPLKEGSQDLLSIQIQVMLDLEKNSLSTTSTYWIIDKDQLKDFLYTREAPAHLETEIGSLDTVVVASRRAGNDRVLRLWFAPSLGYIPVKAERTRSGHQEFAMIIKSLSH